MFAHDALRRSEYKITAECHLLFCNGQCIFNLNMGKNDTSVRERLGNEAWDILIQKSDDGTISAQHMKDISRAFKHQKIGGNHSRRVTEQKVMCDGFEMREILSDWWQEELYGLDQTEALGKLSAVLSNPEVNLPAIASKLRPCSSTDPWDTILGTGILENEPLLKQNMKDIFESLQDPESAASKTPEEAYKMIDIYFKEMVKSKNKSTLQVEQVERETESSFQLPDVKKFVLGEGTLNTKRLKRVEKSRLKLLIMQILENPDNKRRVRQVVSQYKTDISAYEELEEIIKLQETEKELEEIIKLQETEKEAAEEKRKLELKKEQEEKEALRAEKEALQAAMEKRKPTVPSSFLWQASVPEGGGDSGNTGPDERPEDVESNRSSELKKRHQRCM